MASLLQAGPMVQMILARRDGVPFGVRVSSGLGWLGFK